MSDREYWDEVGHKGGCDVYGDEEMICDCTCGPRPVEDEHEGMITEEIIAAQQYVKGKQDAVATLAQFLWDGDAGVSLLAVEDIQVWLAHIIQMNARCGCGIEHYYDDGNSPRYCTWFSDAKNRRELYIDWFQTTEEELRAKERAVAEEEAREKAEADARAKEFRRKQLHQLAQEFNVDPRLLP